MHLKLIFILLLSVVNASADNYPRNEGIDIKHYTFRLELNDSTNILSGEASIRLLVKKPLSEVAFDLVSENRNRQGMQVASVTMKNQSLPFRHANNRLLITLPAAATVNEEITFTVRYSGTPADGLIISKNKFGDRTFFGDNWPDRARHWLPCIDHPYDKAAVDWIVLAPHHYAVVGNGYKVEESYLNPKQKLTHWREEADLPTKVMVIGAARFAIRYERLVEGIPLSSWVYPQNREAGFADYEPAASILQFFNTFIGAYSYPKLANVQSTTRYGGMENASNIFYYENSVTGRGQLQNLIAHEIAHQWFGNSASEGDWHHVWLSEGFATYFTHVYTEFNHGKVKANHELVSARNEVIAYNKRKPAPIINTGITDYSALLTPDVYQRAGWVLHMLRKEIGDEAFFPAVREYYLTYRNSNALTRDFQNIAEKHAGRKLDEFFNQWLYRSTLPALKTSWQNDAQTGMLIVTIDQVQSGELFNLNLDIGIRYGDNRPLQLENVMIRQKSQQFRFRTDGKPENVVPDPQTTLLFEDISRK